MRGVARIFVLAAALSATVPPATGMVSAQPEQEAPPTCSVPAEVAEQFLILYGNAPAVPAAARGDALVLVRFTGADTMRYMVVGTGVWHEGTYTYSSPAPGTAVLDSVDTSGPQPVRYSLTLNCRTDTTGDYRYTAEHADAAPAPGPAETTTVYRFAPTAH
ncbi:hypothetical protein [Nocardia wallacei]|uniref:hypothetical protein n=1 Tax=Nocardia wallacei TaxID=480035 RepID=UPI002458A6FF|nr:hypothetical protein [Nocardia wallacei]